MSLKQSKCQRIGIGFFFSWFLAASAVLGASPTSYDLYWPAQGAQKNIPLVIVLHGCLQNSAEVSAGTRFNNLAEENGFAVLYPNHAPGTQKANCWNWYNLDQLGRGQGEGSQIIAALDEVLKQKSIDRERIYAVGMSAGGAMAAILAACYPERFRGLAIHSGVPYGIATNEQEALMVMKMGPQQKASKGPCEPEKFQGAAIFIHGKNDNVVVKSNFERLIVDFIGQTVDVSEQMQALDQTPEQPNENYTSVVIDYKKGSILKGRSILVDQLGHSWSGGLNGLPYNDAKGPDATRLIWDFFEQTRKQTQAKTRL